MTDQASLGTTTKTPEFGVAAGEVAGFITSFDLKVWSQTWRVATGVSPYGIQMAMWRGEPYGVLTGQDQFLYASRYENNVGWGALKKLPDTFKAVGRVGVATLQDRYYVTYRGTDDKTYLIWTNDFTTWNDLGEMAPDSGSTAAPAIAGYDGKIYVVTAYSCSHLRYAVRQGRTHQVLQGWEHVNPTVESTSAVSLTVHDSALYLFYTSSTNDAIYGSFVEPGSTTWSDWKQIPTTITSGPSSVTFKNNRIFISYRGANQAISRVTVNAAIGDPDFATLPNVKMLEQTGTGTYVGALFITYGVVGRYSLGMEQSEKMTFENEVSDSCEDEWDCKWKEQSSEEKSMMKKFFCM